jgi:transketolase
MALAERWLAARFNRPDLMLVDHMTYVIVSDGDLMEGVSHEACALAGHLGLGKLVVLYDDNGITIDGPTSLAFSEDVAGRFAAYGWHVERIDGHDHAQLEAAIEAARGVLGRPSLVLCKTHIGFGSPNRQDTSKAHGEPLGIEEIKLTKQRLGWPPDEELRIPEEVPAFMRRSGAAGAERREAWLETCARLESAHPEVAAAFRRVLAGELPAGWDADLPAPSDAKPLATRAASGAVLGAIAPRLPDLLGGSADLTPSNNTLPKGEQPLTRESFSGRYVHFGVREHGMGGILNGLALHGGVRPYGGTFLVFSDYLRPAIRMAALMGLPVIYTFTHDSIGLGEDGPTHQPVEQLAALRAIPNLFVFRPADATETTVGWRVALARRAGPTALILTRQALPMLDRERYAAAEQAARGAYVLSDATDPQAILIATGSEVPLALATQELLAKNGVATRVVSMPCWELFEGQPEEYRQRVLPDRLRARVAVEAASTLGWERWVGSRGSVIGLDRFGASAPYKEIFRRLGFTPEAVADAVRRLVS